METAGRCRRCGETITLRTVAGRTYRLNAAGGTGPVGATHTRWCPVKVAERATQGRAALKALVDEAVAQMKPRTVSAALDETRIREIADAAVRESGAREIEVRVRGSKAAAVNVGRQHKNFETLLKVLARRHSICLVGPAGGGKTTGAEMAAKALGLEFGAISVGPQTTQAALFGSRFAEGNYLGTIFRERFEHGGLFLLDEMDRGNPGVLTSLNQALANGVCAFPDGMVKRHPDFVVVAAANTWGRGASREYVGALQLDAATLDRFVMLEWDYDTLLERDLARAAYKAAGGEGLTGADAWVDRVLHVRERIGSLGIRHVVSPRASIVGADLLGSGMEQVEVEAAVLWKGLDAESVRRVQ